MSSKIKCLSLSKPPSSSHPIPSHSQTVRLLFSINTFLSSSGNAECGKNKNRLKLEYFRVYQLWHFKLSNETVTQTGHISVSYTSLLVLLEHHSWAFSPHSVEKKKKINGGFLLSFPFQYFVSCGVFISWVVMNKAHPIEISIYFLRVLVWKK